MEQNGKQKHEYSSLQMSDTLQRSKNTFPGEKTVSSTIHAGKTGYS